MSAKGAGAGNGSSAMNTNKSYVPHGSYGLFEASSSSSFDRGAGTASIMNMNNPYIPKGIFASSASSAANQASPFTLFASPSASSSFSSSSSAYQIPPPPMMVSTFEDDFFLKDEALEYPSAESRLPIDEYILLNEVHNENIETIHSILNSIYTRDLLAEGIDDIDEYLKLTFLYFPPLTRASSPDYIEYTTTFHITKSIRRQIPFNQMFGVVAMRSPVYISRFKVTNNCIMFNHEKYSNKAQGEWDSVLSKQSLLPCFEPPLPSSNNLNLLMELRLILQTLLTTDFSIVDVAEYRRGNYEIPISPFKLVRGEKKTIYMKFGFKPTVSHENADANYKELLKTIQTTKVNSLPMNIQKILESIYTKKGLEFKDVENETIPKIMQPITMEDELDHLQETRPQVAAEVRDKGIFHFNLNTSHNISSLILKNIIKSKEDLKQILYEGKKPSLNFLQYKGGLYTSKHIFITNVEKIVPRSLHHVPTSPPYGPRTPPYGPRSPTATTKTVSSAKGKSSEEEEGGRSWGGENWGGGNRKSRRLSKKTRRNNTKRKRQTKKRPT